MRLFENLKTAERHTLNKFSKLFFFPPFPFFIFFFFLLFVFSISERSSIHPSIHPFIHSFIHSYILIHTLPLFSLHRFTYIIPSPYLLPSPVLSFTSSFLPKLPPSISLLHFLFPLLNSLLSLFTSRSSLAYFRPFL